MIYKQISSEPFVIFNKFNIHFDIQNGPWIAGGAVGKILRNEKLEFSSSDIDIFCKNTSQISTITNELLKWCIDSYESENAFNFEFKDLGLKIQVINKPVANLETLFSNFDFTCCCLATDGRTVVAKDTVSYEDALKKNLRLNEGVVLKKSIFNRITKYIRYGFEPLDGIIFKVLNDIIYQINNNHFQLGEPLYNRTDYESETNYASLFLYNQTPAKCNNTLDPTIKTQLNQHLVLSKLSSGFTYNVIDGEQIVYWNGIAIPLKIFILFIFKSISLHFSLTPLYFAKSEWLKMNDEIKKYIISSDSKLVDGYEAYSIFYKISAYMFETKGVTWSNGFPIINLGNTFSKNEELEQLLDIIVETGI